MHLNARRAADLCAPRVAQVASFATFLLSLGGWLVSSDRAHSALAWVWVPTLAVALAAIGPTGALRRRFVRSRAISRNLAALELKPLNSAAHSASRPRRRGQLGVAVPGSGAADDPCERFVESTPLHRPMARLLSYLPNRREAPPPRPFPLAPCRTCTCRAHPSPPPLPRLPHSGVGFELPCLDTLCTKGRMPAGSRPTLWMLHRRAMVRMLSALEGSSANVRLSVRLLREIGAQVWDSNQFYEVATTDY